MIQELGRSKSPSSLMMSGAAMIVPPRWSAAIVLSPQARDCWELSNLWSYRVGLYGSELANALAAIDQAYDRNCLIVADLSNDPTYGETLVRHVRSARRWRADRSLRRRHDVRAAARQKMALYPSITLAGPSCSNSCSPRCATTGSALPTAPESVRALMSNSWQLEPEQRPSGMVFKCPSGQHDDLAMSLAMLAWAAQHLHLECWTQPIFDAHRPRRNRRQKAGWGAWTSRSSRDDRSTLRHNLRHQLPLPGPAAAS